MRNIDYEILSSKVLYDVTFDTVASTNVNDATMYSDMRRKTKHYPFYSLCDSLDTSF